MTPLCLVRRVLRKPIVLATTGSQAGLIGLKGP
jgi:hypothetical protein